MNSRVCRLAILAVAVLACACGGNVMPPSGGEQSVSGDVRARIANSRIFFAHQSVGENIVDGLKSLPEADGATLRLVSVDEAAPSGPAFIHARLGHNGDPKSKTDAFEQALDAGLGTTVDLAFQKYCYADFEATTDVKAVFGYYKQASERIQRRFPELSVVHVTAPLVTVQSGPRATIKRWIGRVPDYYIENAVREEFNQLMRAEYASSGRLFDLARLESSPQGASPQPILFRGRTLYTLQPEYTTDGGHLNSPTRQWIASELVTFLARFLPPASHPPATRTN
jgi:hypothetical protein